MFVFHLSEKSLPKVEQSLLLAVGPLVAALLCIGMACFDVVPPDAIVMVGIVMVGKLLVLAVGPLVAALL